MRFRIFLFDLDGTLVDSLADIAASVNAARKHFGLPELPRETVRGFVGDGMTKLIERSFPDTSQREQATALFKAHYGAHLADATRPYDGIPELVAEIKAGGGRIAVVTNKPYAFAMPLLEKLDLLKHCDAVLGGDSTREKKPSPEPFFAAFKAMSVSPDNPAAKGCALVVGDGRNDILGAKAAGLASCAAFWGFGDEVELRALGADFSAQRPRELLNLIES
ncbi:MAG: HAD hydrolase-like protein [Planctomycetes bacterium]|nr:HAD hydrolase-like protein [Planctomycetota bacterium]